MVKISASDPVIYSTGKYEVIGLHVYKGLEWPIDISFLPSFTEKSMMSTLETFNLRNSVWKNPSVLLFANSCFFPCFSVT